MSSRPSVIELDLVVVGGGIAGLWLTNRLLSAGYDAVLLEPYALGGEQSLASQGMIHGGIKYGLGGQLGAASRALAEMPERWRACLNGQGEVDLRHTHATDEPLCLWSNGGLGATVQTMLASRALRGRSQRLSGEQRPNALNHPDFRGTVYGLSDLLLDVPSLTANLSANAQGALLRPSDLQLIRDTQGQVSLNLETAAGRQEIRPRQIIFTAGQGNAELLAQLGLTEPAMQTRPLRQLMVKSRQLTPLYGHCLGKGSRPRLTVSSHRADDGDWIWYLGGELAETGAQLSHTEQIAQGQAELAQLFPWLDWQQAQWRSLLVQRAEPRQTGTQRPDGASLHAVPTCNNLLVGWPTKLTLAPHLTDLALAALSEANVHPSGTEGCRQLRALLPVPPLADAPWQTAFKEAK